MNIRQSAYIVAGVGALTAAMLALGFGTVGGTMALFQLGCLVGAPLAMMLHHELRSWRVVAVVAVALSMALTAIAVQFLIWFKAATPVLLVLTATTYGVVLAFLVSSADLRRSGAGSDGVR